MKNNSDSVWKALSDPTRRDILDMLREGPRLTGEICEAFPMSRIGVIKHITILRECGFVLVRNRGRERWNHLNAVPLQAVLRRWTSRYSRLWADSLLDLKQVTEHNWRNSMKNVEARGFEIEQEVLVQAPRERVWQAFAEEMDSWFKHRILGPDSRLHCELKAGAAMIERKGDQEVLWATITAVNPGSFFRAHGPLGMQDDAIASTWSYHFEDAADGTLVKLRHVAYGTQSPEMADAHEGGWNVLFDYLKTWIEKGTTFREQQS